MENELQDWQEEILKMEGNPLLESQVEMIERVLYPSDSNPFFVVEKYAGILRRVLLSGCYLEEDKEALNYVRECYLRGNNFIK